MDEDASKIRQHRSYEKAKSKAGKYKDNPEEMESLINEAVKKAGTNMPRNFNEIKDSVFTLFQMVRCYAKRDYTEIPWQSVLLMISSIVYFVSPIDMVPDFIPIFGYIDDVALLGWTLKSLTSDIEAFKIWKKKHDIEN